MADDVTVSERTLQDQVALEIKVLLTRRGMSHLQLAQAAGMKQAYLSRRMTGEITFDLEDLSRIAAALEVDPPDLFPAEETPESAAVAPAGPRVIARAGRRQPTRRSSYYTPSPNGGPGHIPEPSGSPVRPASTLPPAPDRPPGSRPGPSGPNRQRPHRVARPVD